MDAYYAQKVHFWKQQYDVDFSVLMWVTCIVTLTIRHVTNFPFILA
jgi:hypothetical protein